VSTITNPMPVQPTVDDAKMLAIVYKRLSLAAKKLQAANREVKKSWAVSLVAVDDARAERDSAQENLDRIFSDAWQALVNLPSGTTASGGATAQTVALEFFSSNLNRTLKARITPMDARRINSRSFG